MALNFSKISNVDQECFGYHAAMFMICTGLLAELGIRCTQELGPDTSLSLEEVHKGQSENATALHGLWNSKPDQKLKSLPFN